MKKFLHGAATASMILMVLADAPAAPAARFKATAVSGTEIQLTWETPARLDSYELHRRENGQGAWQLLASPEPDAQTFSDTGLPQGRRFEYRLTSLFAVAAPESTTAPPTATFGTGILFVAGRTPSVEPFERQTGARRLMVVDVNGLSHFSAFADAGLSPITFEHFVDNPLVPKSGLPGRSAASIALWDQFGSQMVNFKGRVVFAGANDEVGYELWQYDGVTTELVSDIVPGPLSSRPTAFFVSENHLYFTARDRAHGRELWRWDGDAPPERLTDLLPGIGPPGILQIDRPWPTTPVELGETVYFLGDDGSSDHIRLWRIDLPSAPVPAGDPIWSPTALAGFAGDIIMVEGATLWSWNPAMAERTEIPLPTLGTPALLGDAWGLLFVRISDTLFTFDGEQFQTVATGDISAHRHGDELRFLIGDNVHDYADGVLVDSGLTLPSNRNVTAPLGTGFVFSLTVDGESELWQASPDSDPQMVTDLNPGHYEYNLSVAEHPSALLKTDANIYLHRNNFFLGGGEIWSPGQMIANRAGQPFVLGDTIYWSKNPHTLGALTDGGEIREIQIDTDTTFMLEGTPMFGRWFFEGHSPEGGAELWAFNGVTANQVADLAPGIASSLPHSLTPIGARLYFLTGDNFTERHLYCLTATGPPQRVAMPEGFSPTAIITEIGGQLLFFAEAAPAPAVPFLYDGTNPPVAADPDAFQNIVFHGCAVGDTYYSVGTDAAHGTELWAYRPETGNQLAADMATGVASSRPIPPVALNGRVYFTPAVIPWGTDLWELTEGETPRPLFLNPSRFTVNNFGRIDAQAWILGTVSLGHAPTTITLSATAVPEIRPPGQTVGTLHCEDPDGDLDTHTFQLIPGTGDGANSLFSIDGARLLTAAIFDFESLESYPIRVRGDRP